MADHTASLRAVAGFLVALSVLGGAGVQAGEQPAASWVRQCPGNAFCFTRPASLLQQPAQGIDSLVARYRGGGVSLSFDLGQYGTTVDPLLKPNRRAITIDGRPAEVLSSEREIVLLVPKVHDGVSGTLKFSMTLQFDGMASRDLAQRIFQSIEFMPPR